MKYMDYAAMGAAFSASQRASEAFDEIERLQNQIDAMRLSIWDDRDEREFERWIEEFIYQFGKVTGRIEASPGDQVQDFLEITGFLKIIEEKKINTSVISGLENKKVFEDVLGRAERLYGDLWNHPGSVEQRDLWAKQEAEEKKRHAIRVQERMDADFVESVQKAQRLKRLRRRRFVMGSVAGIFGLGTFATIVVAALGNEPSPFFVICLAIWLIIWAWADSGWRQE